MSTFKKIKPRDVFVSSHLAKKRREIPQSEYFNLAIVTGSFTSGSATNVQWISTQHLYYSNFNNSLTESGSFENYLQTTLHESSSRELADTITTLSIPRDLIGVGIQPNTFSLESGSIRLVDDGEGQVFNESLKVGDIIYPHGIIILSGSASFNLSESTASFNSRQPLHTLNVHCRTYDSEMNFTSNPSAMITASLDGIVSRSGGVYRSDVTGSDFQPYITSIGLYNDSNELLAVAKLGRPTPKSQNTDMTFIVRIDM